MCINDFVLPREGVFNSSCDGVVWDSLIPKAALQGFAGETLNLCPKPSSRVAGCTVHIRPYTFQLREGASLLSLISAPPKPGFRALALGLPESDGAGRHVAVIV